MVTQMTPNPNPLRRYFRQPAIHLRLPSAGKYYPTGAITLPPNGEVPILPMTAVDEITSRTPDALFNGSAVADILASCVPAIRDPWSVPSVDLNALLCAVRLASYGHDMEISSRCPKCGHTHELTLDLRHVLDQLKSGNYDEPLTVGDLVMFFRPMTYRQINQNSRTSFEDQKLMQMLNDVDMPEEEKMTRLGEAFKNMTRITIQAIVDSMAAVKTADAMVTEPEHIAEFLYNCPKALFDQIRDRAIALREASDYRPVAVTCPECTHQYQQTFTLDMSNFFVNAS